jgi:phage gpG-like protein
MNVTNLNEFRAQLAIARNRVEDLSVPLGEIARDFYKSQKAIFMLKSPGGYQDLSEQYKVQKKRGDKNHHGVPIYPILKRSGRLEYSITEPGSPENITVIGKDTLEIGTTVPYGVYHDSDTPRRKIPHRKFLFIGPESREFGSKKEFGGRPIRWKNIIEFYIKSVMGEL